MFYAEWPLRLLFKQNRWHVCLRAQWVEFRKIRGTKFGQIWLPEFCSNWAPRIFEMEEFGITVFDGTWCVISQNVPFAEEKQLKRNDSCCNKKKNTTIKWKDNNGGDNPSYLTMLGTAVTFSVPTDSRTPGTVFRLHLFHYNFVSVVYYYNFVSGVS